MKRTAVVAFALTGFAITALPACSDSTRYEMLSFFFDGVPKPGTEQVDSVADGDVPGAVPGSRRRPVVQIFSHTPYRENRCGGCHDQTSGSLVRPIDDGLCLGCHNDLIRPLEYVHGPVAVEGCYVCHHYHASEFKGLLRAPADELCFECHAASDLGEGPHHDALEETSCAECHDPHGGSDPFFLVEDG